MVHCLYDLIRPGTEGSGKRGKRERARTPARVREREKKIERARARARPRAFLLGPSCTFSRRTSHAYRQSHA